MSNQILNLHSIYPRKNDDNTCLLKNVIAKQNICVGDYTYYHDFVDPTQFEVANVLYHYPINNDKLIIGKFCSIASGAKFIFNGGNHKNHSFVNYPFAIFPDVWNSNLKINESWDNKGDIIVGNDVWIGYEAVIMAGVKIGNGARIGTRTIVTKDVGDYEVVVGAPGKAIKKRFDDETIGLLNEIRWWDWEKEKIEENLGILTCDDKTQLAELRNKCQKWIKP